MLFLFKFYYNPLEAYFLMRDRNSESMEKLGELEVGEVLWKKLWEFIKINFQWKKINYYSMWHFVLTEQTNYL